jgi:uncharacterized Zn finger protein
MSWYHEYKPYVSVAQKRAKAAKEMQKLAKNGLKITPVNIAGRKITTTFWGDAWCTNLEGYSDFVNRLPRGRTYVRNGSVVHMSIEEGLILAYVSGSELYKVKIKIKPLAKDQWERLKRESAGKMGTLIELLQGKLSKSMMEMVTDRKNGLFPKPSEIEMKCSCPDYAGMCKHVAAVMYGIGNRLDSSPEMLFELRGVDHLELIEQAIPAAPIGARTGTPAISNDDLSDIFGIELSDETPASRSPAKTSAKSGVKQALTPKAPVKGPAKVAAKPVQKKVVAKNARPKPQLKESEITKMESPKASPKSKVKKAVATKVVAKVAVKPAVKAAVKKEVVKPAVKAVAKVAAKPAAKATPVKAAAKPVVKPAAKAVAKVAAKPAAKAPVKAAVKPVAKKAVTAVKAPVKAVAKVAVKAVAAAPVKAAAKPSAKAAAVKKPVKAVSKAKKG